MSSERTKIFLPYVGILVTYRLQRERGRRDQFMKIR